MAPDRDFETIILDARKGDEAALTELYRALYPRVLRYLRAVEPTEAEDLACDAWLDVMRGLDGFRGDEGALRAFAFSIARRRALDLRRRRARRRTDPREPHALIDAGATGDVEEEALSSLGRGWAVDLITSSLSSPQAEVVLLRVLGDLDVERGREDPRQATRPRTRAAAQGSSIPRPRLAARRCNAMTDWNDLPNEMRRLKLDEDTVDRLLAGRIGPDDAPPGYSEVARVLVAAASSNDRDALVHETEHVALAAALLGQPTPVSKPSDGRSRSMKRSRRMKVGGLVVVGAMVGSTGLAAAGVLPDAAQDAFSAVLERVGISVPASGDHPTSVDRQASSGEEISGIATTTDATGVDKGGRDLVRGERRREPGRGAWLERGRCGWLGCGWLGCG